MCTDSIPGKRPLGSPRYKLEDSIRMDLKEIGINMRNWDYWRALVNLAMNLRVPELVLTEFTAYEYNYFVKFTGLNPEPQLC